MPHESLDSWLRDFYTPDPSMEPISQLSQNDQSFHFAMRANGLDQLTNGQWYVNTQTNNTFAQEFKGQDVSFFGPKPTSSFFSVKENCAIVMSQTLKQRPVLDTISHFRAINPRQAARVAFILGGLVRHQMQKAQPSPESITNQVKYVAEMTRLGRNRSSDAVASAMAMYVLSGGSTDNDPQFTRDVALMAKSIEQDNTSLDSTMDLGLSQVNRLHSFLNKAQFRPDEPCPSILAYKPAFEGFPTVGAEWHFRPEVLQTFPSLWKKLAILNMSQYRAGSYIQMCRQDDSIINVRINPSIYPVLIAGWMHMRTFLPEINQAYFLSTVNQPVRDFSHDQDLKLFEDLRAVGLLVYASYFRSVPQLAVRENEVQLGQAYLGQTERVEKGRHQISGQWYGNEGKSGQFGVYTGFGNNFVDLSYYLSMGLANSKTIKALESYTQVKTLKQALDWETTDRRSFFENVNRQIMDNQKLRQAFIAGKHIMSLLNP